MFMWSHLLWSSTNCKHFSNNKHLTLWMKFHWICSLIWYQYVSLWKLISIIIYKNKHKGTPCLTPSANTKASAATQEKLDFKLSHMLPHSNDFPVSGWRFPSLSPWEEKIHGSSSYRLVDLWALWSVFSSHWSGHS